MRSAGPAAGAILTGGGPLESPHALRRESLPSGAPSAGRAAVTSLLREIALFVRQERKWWLVPLLIVLAVLALFVLLAAFAPGLAPFVYPLG